MPGMCNVWAIGDHEHWERCGRDKVSNGKYVRKEMFLRAIIGSRSADYFGFTREFHEQHKTDMSIAKIDEGEPFVRLTCTDMRTKEKKVWMLNFDVYKEPLCGLLQEVVYTSCVEDLPKIKIAMNKEEYSEYAEFKKYKEGLKRNYDQQRDPRVNRQRVEF